MCRIDKKTFYETRARRYIEFDRQGYLRYTLAADFARVQDGVKVLDVGCKRGYLGDILESRNVDFHYCGIDISRQAIAKSACGNRAYTHPASFTICDVMEGIPYPDNYFDHVFCLELIEHVDNPTFLAREMGRVLKKPNGTCILSTPNPSYYLNVVGDLLKMPENEGHIASFAYANVSSLLWFAGLQILDVRGTYGLVPLGIHGIRNRRYLMIETSLPFFTRSYMYKVGSIQ